jgi:hypothetical protein
LGVILPPNPTSVGSNGCSDDRGLSGFVYMRIYVVTPG